MEISHSIGYFLAVLVGISLGLMGSGGSILTVPILVYVMGISPVLATAYSLFIVGTTATVGSIRNAFENNIDFRKVLIFGIPSMTAVFLTRGYLVPFIPENIAVIGNFEITKSLAVMVLFAIVMLLSSYTMLRQQTSESTIVTTNKLNYPLIFLLGLGIGVVAGLVGAGGGFLIVPALVFLANTKMKRAIGTSLCIVALQSLIGFIGDLKNTAIDWQLLGYFTTASVIGIFIGLALAKKIPSGKLKKGFGWFVLAMAVYILVKELA
ncbi:MAG: sulfite exporter TauE/SafE family protein [Flavobacterium sp.]|nr:sulfite exporter TauE/SafE family protein [Flavobacterium sp.]